MTTLEKLVDRYGEVNSRAKELDDEKKELNQRIKSELTENHTTEYVGSKYKAILQERVSESLNEEKVIAILKANYLDYGIKTREYIDEAELETAIFNGLIPPNVLKAISDCKITKKTNALLVKEIK